MFRWLFILTLFFLSGNAAAESPNTIREFVIKWRPTLEDATEKVEKFCDAAEVTKGIRVIDVQYQKRHGHYHATIICRVSDPDLNLGTLYPKRSIRDFYEVPDFSDLC